jgi:D-alanyl-lipoteichoic acid acyltransferase DltB (MBOAT superfamily)
MLFNSWAFLIFYPIVTIGYYLLPQARRWIWLLTASCIFYMAFIPAYIGILVFLILIDFGAAIVIERSAGATRRAALITSITATCTVLIVFKYFNFFATGIWDVARLFDLHYPAMVVRIILPIGLSFHTFQSLSYVIEVYRGNHRAERHIGIYALYVLFYPQLVAGPIERPQGLLDQFRVRHEFDYDAVTGGLRLMAWGFFKKVVVADRLASFVTPAFADPGHYAGIPLVLATIFFAFQIYCDFSGYSDIAIGAAATMGIRLRENFNRPYAAASVAEFWHRWHMSLSTWFRDYVYIPLGGNRVSAARWIRNILVTFLLSGLWHGAAMTFVVWGALHGTFIIVGRFTRAARDAVWRALGLEESSIRRSVGVLTTFVLVTLAWVPFRASDLNAALHIYSLVITQTPGQLRHLVTGATTEVDLFAGSLGSLAIAVALIATVQCAEIVQSRGDRLRMLARSPMILRWAAYYGLIASFLFLGVFGRTPFIYFQF